MIKNIVFHIGNPKTGSSSIQAALQNRACTCDSVTIAPQKELNASAMANALNPNRRPKRYEPEMQKKVAWAAETDGDLGVISAEFFSVVDPGALMTALKDYMPGYADSARVVAYVRPHASQIISSYGQRVKTGTFVGGFKGFLELPPAQQKFTYFPRFKRWQKVFGDRFTLRPFIREELRDRDVTADFFHVALQGAAFSLEAAKQTNESLTLEEIAGMRVVQSVLIKGKVPAFLRLSVGGAVGRELAGLPDRSRNRLALNKKSAGLVMDTYLADARKLDAQFFEGGPMERALVTATDEAKPKTLPVTARTYFPPHDISRLQELSKELAELVKKKPQAWRQSYQLRIGQLRTEDTKPLPKLHQKNATAVWEVLGQITGILNTGRAGQAGIPKTKAKT